MHLIQKVLIMAYRKFKQKLCLFNLSDSKMKQRQTFSFKISWFSSSICSILSAVAVENKGQRPLAALQPVI